MFVRKFPTLCSINLVTGERAGGRTLQLRSEGFLAFAIGPRAASSVVDLRLIDAEARISPFTVEVDGRQIHLDEITLTGADFDTDASRGEVDQQTNKGWFRLAFDLRLAHLPGLRGIVDVEELRIEIVERGTIDVARGRIIETHADTFDIPSSLPRSLVAGVGPQRARNSKGPACAVDTVRLGGILSDEFTPSDQNERDSAQNALIVCPRTSITLPWGIKDVSAVKKAQINDKKGGPAPSLALNPSGSGTVVVTPIDDAEYELQVSDPSCAPRSASVTVWIVKPGKEITLNLLWNPNTGIATWKGNPKFIGKGVFATSIRTIDCSGLVAPPVPLWDYQFTDMDGRVSYGEVGTKFGPLGGDLPLRGATWDFSPKVVDRDPSLIVCFQIRCACR